MIAQYTALGSPRIVGLISGTSADAIDAALVEISGPKMRLLRFHSHPFPESMRPLLFDLFEDRASVRQAALAHFQLGELFAQAALEVMQGEPVDLICSHGQTVAHLPPQATLQLGEAACIAAATGVMTVSDFRPADLVLGGQAAPLVPYFDHWLLHSPLRDRAAINIGGMANVSWIPRQGPTLGWDSGPGNVLSDALAQRFLGQAADRGGALAAQGRVVPELLQRLLAHPYFQERGPKSTGRELFGADFLQPYMDVAAPADLLRTVLALTVETLLDSLQPHIPATGAGEVELVVGGGGYHNPVLMEELRQRAAARSLTTLLGFEAFGISADAREACAFALLGHQTLHQRCSSLPQVTGARAPALLGKLSFPPPP